MKERLLAELIPQVERNCLISDANYWGHYSICGLLLRLRELYRFQENLGPFDNIPHAKVSDWIERTEAAWHRARDWDISTLRVTGMEFDAFDARSVNRVLETHGILYGAGYGLFMKPVFFLADLDGTETAGGCRIYIAGREYARDLSLHPAMLQEDVILARRHVSEVLIGQKFEEFRASKRNPALKAAFEAYGVSDGSSEEDLARVAHEELRTYIHHELGEHFESAVLGPGWRSMVSSLGQGKASVLARALKDVLADTSERGMLRHIIDGRKGGSLAFYILFLSGYRRLLSDRIVRAYAEFSAGGDWGRVEDARASCYGAAREDAQALLAAYAENDGGRALEEEAARQASKLSPSRPS